MQIEFSQCLPLHIPLSISSMEFHLYKTKTKWVWTINFDLPEKVVEDLAACLKLAILCILLLEAGGQLEADHLTIIILSFFRSHLGRGTTVHVVILWLCCPLVTWFVMMPVGLVLLWVLCDSFKNERLMTLHFFRCIAEWIAGFDPAEDIWSEQWALLRWTRCFLWLKNTLHNSCFCL